MSTAGPFMLARLASVRTQNKTILPVCKNQLAAQAACDRDHRGTCCTHALAVDASLLQNKKIQVYLLATFISLCGGDHKRGRSGGPDFSFERLFGLPTAAKRRLGCSGVRFAPVPTRLAWAPGPESIPLRRGIPPRALFIRAFRVSDKINDSTCYPSSSRLLVTHSATAHAQHQQRRGAIRQMHNTRCYGLLLVFI
ncbi:MAG: hypothetical protein ACK5ZY_17125 [Cyclobacteriaceae bacterium]